MKYDIIYADPPWHYRSRNQFGFAGDVGVDSGGAIKHYETIPVRRLKKLNVQDVCAEDCLLYMWITNPLLMDGIAVATAWGFEQYATVGFVWNKLKTNPGYYTMSSCEMCYIFKRGRIPQPRGARNVRQYYEEKRTRHSAKPAELRKRIEQMFPMQNKLELFARDKTPGWHVWGNEVDSDVVIDWRNDEHK